MSRHVVDRSRWPRWLVLTAGIEGQLTDEFAVLVDDPDVEVGYRHRDRAEQVTRHGLPALLNERNAHVTLPHVNAMRNTTYHKRRLKMRMKDPEFRAEHKRASKEIDAIDTIIRRLDERREEIGLTKADLARAIGRDPASIRRLFTAKGNPQLNLIAAVAHAVDAEIQVVSRKRGSTRTTRRTA